MFTLNVSDAPITLRAEPVVADETVGRFAYEEADPAIDTTFVFTLYRDFNGSEPVFETLEAGTGIPRESLMRWCVEAFRRIGFTYDHDLDDEVEIDVRAHLDHHEWQR